MEIPQIPRYSQSLVPIQAKLSLNPHKSHFPPKPSKQASQANVRSNHINRCSPQAAMNPRESPTSTQCDWAVFHFTYCQLARLSAPAARTTIAVLLLAPNQSDKNTKEQKANPREQRKAGTESPLDATIDSTGGCCGPGLPWGRFRFLGLISQHALFALSSRPMVQFDGVPSIIRGDAPHLVAADSHPVDKTMSKGSSRSRTRARGTFWRGRIQTSQLRPLAWA
ncbi:hypothetical protein V8C42DRAFT_298564 [Trichoderma barbatum]